MTADQSPSVDAAEEPATVSLPTDFRNREQLIADLSDAVVEASRSTLMVIFELGGLKAHTRAFGSHATNGLLYRLAGRLGQELDGAGRCYNLRGGEFCTLIDDPVSDRSALLETLAASLGENGDGYEVSAAFGAVLLPNEAADVAVALELADQRLNFQKRARTADPHSRFEPAVA